MGCYPSSFGRMVQDISETERLRSMRTIISEATIVNEERQCVGSVIIEDERIVEVLDGVRLIPTGDDLFIDARGLYLFPGVIDDHVHFREPGYEYKADIESESRTAAAGGVKRF